MSEINPIEEWKKQIEIADAAEAKVKELEEHETLYRNHISNLFNIIKSLLSAESLKYVPRLKIMEDEL